MGTILNIFSRGFIILFFERVIIKSFFLYKNYFIYKGFFILKNNKWFYFIKEIFEEEIFFEKEALQSLLKKKI